MSRRIYLIRHGETTWNREGRCQGFTDVPLSELGVRQARRLSRTLKGAGLGAVYSSDLMRAKKTADAIARPHGLEVRMDVRLREMNQGRMEGKNLQQMLKDHPKVLEDWIKSPSDVKIPGGESLRLLQSRGWHAFQEILKNNGHGDIAIVAHNLLNVTILCKVLGISLNNFRRIKQHSCALNEIEDSRHGLVVVRLNDTHHLD